MSASPNAAVLDRKASPARDRDAARNSKEDILEAAAHCFMENGFAATSIDDVARLMGATKGMIYHHYRSKTDLFFAVYERGMALNDRAVRPFVEGEYEALERLVKMGLAHANVLMAQQSYQRVLAQGVAMHQTGSTTAAQREALLGLIESRDEYERLFRAAVGDAAAQLGVTVNDISLATRCFLAVLNSTVFWYSPRSEDEGEDRDRLARDLVDYALRGLGADFAARANLNTSPAPTHGTGTNEFDFGDKQ